MLYCTVLLRYDAAARCLRCWISFNVLVLYLRCTVVVLLWIAVGVLLYCWCIAGVLWVWNMIDMATHTVDVRGCGGGSGGGGVLPPITMVVRCLLYCSSIAAVLLVI